MRPVPTAGIPQDLGAFLAEVRDAVMELANPTMPHRAYRAASYGLPPATKFTGCVVALTDLPTLAVSDGTDWRRADTGAVL
jgi:hypothetical protein